MNYQIGTEAFVYLATAAQVLGLLVTRQIILRVLVLVGSSLFVAYYYFHLGQPQWDALVGSSLIGLANLIGLLLLLHSRLPIGMKAQDRVLFDAFGGLEPGQFRRLMKIGHVVRTDQPVLLTEEGQPVEKLVFVTRGTPMIEKDGQAFRIRNNSFVGEVAFKLDTPASATVTLPEGGTYVEWPRPRLDAMLSGAPILAQAFDAMIARDMAAKVALSAPVPTRALQVSPRTGDIPAEVFGLQHAI